MEQYLPVLYSTINQRQRKEIWDEGQKPLTSSPLSGLGRGQGLGVVEVLFRLRFRLRLPSIFDSSCDSDPGSHASYEIKKHHSWSGSIIMIIKSIKKCQLTITSSFLKITALNFRIFVFQHFSAHLAPQTTFGSSIAGTCFSSISFKWADRSRRNLGTRIFSL